MQAVEYLKLELRQIYRMILLMQLHNLNTNSNNLPAWQYVATVAICSV